MSAGPWDVSDLCRLQFSFAKYIANTRNAYRLQVPMVLSNLFQPPDHSLLAAFTFATISTPFPPQWPNRPLDFSSPFGSSPRQAKHCHCSCFPWILVVWPDGFPLARIYEGLRFHPSLLSVSTWPFRFSSKARIPLMSPSHFYSRIYFENLSTQMDDPQKRNVDSKHFPLPNEQKRNF